MYLATLEYIKFAHENINMIKSETEQINITHYAKAKKESKKLLHFLIITFNLTNTFAKREREKKFGKFLVS